MSLIHYILLFSTSYPVTAELIENPTITFWKLYLLTLSNVALLFPILLLIKQLNAVWDKFLMRILAVK